MERVSIGPLDVLTVPELFQLHYEADRWFRQASQAAMSLQQRGWRRPRLLPYLDMVDEFRWLDDAIVRRIQWLRSGYRRA